MTISIEPAKVGRSAAILTIIFEIYLRILAVAFFALTIVSWLLVIGYWEGPNNRFDTMNSTWKVYAAVLIVLLPVTSVGLWATLSWGRVVWFFVIGFQTVAILRFPGEFSDHGPIMIFHAFTLAIYLILQLSLFVIAKKE